MIKQTIQIPKDLCEQVNGFLVGNSVVLDAGKDEILLAVSTGVEGVTGRAGLEVDIKVVNSESGPYIDAVLFEGGLEVCCLEPSFEQFDGEYKFFLDEQEIVILVESNDEDEV